MFRKLEFTPKCKTEINWIEEKGMMCYLQEMFNKHYNLKRQYGNRNIEMVFGLPYTSSGICAEYSNTNVQFEIESGINLTGFGIYDNNGYGYIIAFASTQDNQDLYYVVENNED